MFEKSLSKISHFECVADSLALGVLREVEMREEIVVEAIWLSIRNASER
jgi:hypothetical protein